MGGQRRQRDGGVLASSGGTGNRSTSGTGITEPNAYHGEPTFLSHHEILWYALYCTPSISRPKETAGQSPFLSHTIYLYFFLFIKSPCLASSSLIDPSALFLMAPFLSPKSTSPFLSLLLPKYPLPHPPSLPPSLSIYPQNIAYPFLLISFQPSGNFHNEKLSSTLFLLSSSLLCLV